MFFPLICTNGLDDQDASRQPRELLQSKGSQTVTRSNSFSCSNGSRTISSKCLVAGEPGICTSYGFPVIPMCNIFGEQLLWQLF